MKTLLGIAMCAAYLAITPVVYADGTDSVVKVYSLEVKDRIQTLELINVTAENPIPADAAAPEKELAEILAETEALEIDQPE